MGIIAVIGLRIREFCADWVRMLEPIRRTKTGLILRRSCLDTEGLCDAAWRNWDPQRLSAVRWGYGAHREGVSALPEGFSLLTIAAAAPLVWLHTTGSSGVLREPCLRHQERGRLSLG